VSTSLHHDDHAGGLYVAGVQHDDGDDAAAQHSDSSVACTCPIALLLAVAVDESPALLVSVVGDPGGGADTVPEVEAELGERSGQAAIEALVSGCFAGGRPEP
jgi:hypothetical protein